MSDLAMATSQPSQWLATRRGQPCQSLTIDLGMVTGATEASYGGSQKMGASAEGKSRGGCRATAGWHAALSALCELWGIDQCSLGEGTGNPECTAAALAEGGSEHYSWPPGWSPSLMSAGVSASVDGDVVGFTVSG